jgi:hypothetical protein
MRKIIALLVFATPALGGTVATATCAVWMGGVGSSVTDPTGNCSTSGLFGGLPSMSNAAISVNDVLSLTAVTRDYAYCTGCEAQSTVSAQQTDYVSTAGPQRPGFLFMSWIMGGGGIEDSSKRSFYSVLASAPGLSISGQGADSFTIFVDCSGTLYGDGCIVPVTLGQQYVLFDLSVTDTSWGILGIVGGEAAANLSLAYYESDGTTSVPFSASLTTPEPGTLLIVFGGILMIALKAIILVFQKPFQGNGSIQNEGTHQ